MNPPVRVFLVDDVGAFRALMRFTLEEDPRIQVVGEAADGCEGVSGVEALQPDVVLLDVVLPDSDGFAVLDRLLADPTPPAVVLVSTRDASDYGDRVARSGAKGFIQKASLSASAMDALLG